MIISRGNGKILEKLIATLRKGRQGVKNGTPKHSNFSHGGECGIEAERFQ
jgi:hypothetical protein